MARFKPGIVFRDGKLYEFTHYRITVRTAGPKPPKAWSRTTRATWSTIRPPVCRAALLESIPQSESDRLFKAGLPDARGQWPLALELIEKPRFKGHDAYLAWLRTLDLDDRRAIAVFKERHWHILQLLVRCPGARDLVAHSPALAFALASSWVFRGRRRVCRPLRSARTLLLKPQRDILKWLGFPDNQSSARILRRVPAGEVSIAGLLYLRDGLRDHDVHKRLSHTPVVSRVVIRIATDPTWSKLVSPALLNEVASMNDGGWEVVMHLREALTLARRLRPRGLDRDGWIRSVSDLHTFHQEMRTLHQRLLDGGGIDPEDYPDPPVPGTPTIVPLSDPLMLLEEGELQHNCAASYAREVLSSTVLAADRRPGLYLYRVLQPERATLSIIKRNGAWRIDQLKGPANGPVLSQTRRAVIAWLRGTQEQS